MRSVQINTFDISGGAARAAFRLHKGLLNSGIDDSMLVRFAKLRDNRVVEISDSSIEPIKLKELKPCELIQRVSIDSHRTGISNTVFTFPYPGLDVSAVPRIVEADIINLHWVTYFLSVTTLGKLFSLGKSLVWTLHDQWPFTGGCHYSAGCNGFQSDCLRCPQLSDDRFELANAVLRDKIEFFRGANLTIVTPSKWLAENVRKSSVFKGCRVEIIPNSIETDMFYPVQKSEAKKALEIPADGVAILFCAEIGNEIRKGFRLFVESIRECANHPEIRKLSDEGKFVLLCIGEPNDEINSLGLPVKSLGFVTSDEKMRSAYSAADLYVLPSLEDNLPNTMLESMACGTPVVAFKVGGMPDMIKPGETGFLAPVGDVDAMAELIQEIILNDALRTKMADNCRTLIVKEYGLEVQAKRYAALYEDLVNGVNAKNYDKSAMPTEYLAKMDYTFGPNTERIYKDLVRTAFMQLPLRKKVNQIVEVFMHIYYYLLNFFYHFSKNILKYPLNRAYHLYKRIIK